MSRSRHAIGPTVGLWAVLVALVAPLAAQQQTPHFEHAGILSPGTIGARALLRGGPLPGYFQPVELKGPEGSKISVALDNQFTDSVDGSVKVGLLIAPVYRFKVTGIPRNPGAEVYPTVELINRTYPPRGREFEFPVPIEFTAEDLELALQGKLVTRVVYVENPRAALPQAIKDQRYYEVAPGRDPLVEADRLGRPVAILRIGSRVPDDRNGPDVRFLFGCPAMFVPGDLLPKIYPQGMPGAVVEETAVGDRLRSEPALLPFVQE